jgi:hypothetical protein
MHSDKQGAGDGRQQVSMPSPAAVSALLPMLTSNNVPDAIQTAFQIGDTGFAAPVAHILQETHQQVCCNGGASQMFATIAGSRMQLD